VPGRGGVELLLGPVGGPDLVEALFGLEEPLDLLEVHPERLAQLEDALELDQVALAVAPLPARRVLRGAEQAQLVVVAQGAGGDADARGGVADAQTRLRSAARW
jgi:hypothetical protein